MGPITSLDLATGAGQREDTRCVAYTELIGEKMGICFDLLRVCNHPTIVGCVTHTPQAKRHDLPLRLVLSLYVRFYSYLYISYTEICHVDRWSFTGAVRNH